MTNAEKYLKDGVDIKELWENFSDYYCKNKNKESDVAKAFKLFFLEQAKPTLTEDERVVLEFIKDFDYIGRDEKGLYYKVQDEDIKEKTAVIYNLTTNLFHFIQERRRISY